MKATPSIEYTIGYQFNVYDKSKPFEDEKTLMQELLLPVVNYALPFIALASQVLSKSKPFTLGQFVFQTMPTSKFVKEGDEFQYQYIYEGKDYREGILVTPMDANDKAHKNEIFTKAIRQMILNKKYSGYRPIQFATIWNDTIPSAYMEVHRRTDKTFLQITYDDNNVYNHFIISYPSNSVSDKDMHDIVQYMKNTKETYNEKREGIGAKIVGDMVRKME